MKSDIFPILQEIVGTPPQFYGTGGIKVLGEPQPGSVLIAVSSTEFKWMTLKEYETLREFGDNS